MKEISLYNKIFYIRDYLFNLPEDVIPFAMNNIFYRIEDLLTNTVMDYDDLI